MTTVVPSGTGLGAAGGPDAQQLAVTRQGHYAGPVTRLVGYAVDQGIVNGLYTVTLAFLDAGNRAINGQASDLKIPTAVATVAYALWWLVYFTYPWAASGRTPGMALFGIRVVRTDGAVLSPGKALVRAVTFPLGFVTFGFGFLWALVDGRRRTLYDVLAGSSVVYDWDARAARLRFLARNSAPATDEVQASSPTSQPAPSQGAQPGG